MLICLPLVTMSYCSSVIFTGVPNVWLGHAMHLVSTAVVLHALYCVLRGNLDDQELVKELALVRDTLTSMDVAHFNEYLAAWPAD